MFAACACAIMLCMTPNADLSKSEPQYQELMLGQSNHRGQIAATLDPPQNREANTDPYTDPEYNRPPGLVENETNKHFRFSPEIKAGIDECLRCHKACLSEAMSHCLETTGAQGEPLLRLLMSCAEVCQTSANLGLMCSPFHGALCGVCAQVCEACAKSCEEVEGMAHCAVTCRKCAGSCFQMAQMTT